VSDPVPFLDLAGCNARFAAAFGQALDRVGRSGQWILGPELAAFETEYAAFCGCRHALGVANGLDALELVLRAWGIGAGDEVIVPSRTFIATWNAVALTGATPVPAESPSGSDCLDAAAIERAASLRTRAVIPVHLYGRMAPMHEIMPMARARGLCVLEDAAQAHGARLHGIAAGAWGDAAAFSFYPAKNLGALGDGGMVTTDDETLAAALRAWRNYGGTRRYEHDTMGRNSRLDELQAAFLRAKLPLLSSDNEHRARIARRYLAAFEDIDSLELPVPDTTESSSSWHLFVVRHAQRDRLARMLADKGVATHVHYPKPPHRQGAFAAAFATVRGFESTDRWSEEALSLPIGPTMDDAAVAVVIEAVRSATLELT
jgi:dTDP-4-amino-4,6-dideoxygalactose transaminase